MTCLFHDDYGPADPGFAVSSAASGSPAWTADPSLLKGARNIGEAEAIERHLLRGEAVMWCHQGYSWVDQDAIVWLYAAAFAFVVLPHLLRKVKAVHRRAAAEDAAGAPLKGSSGIRS